MSSVPTVGVERAFRRELGVSLEELGDEWREDVQSRLLPAVGGMERPHQVRAANAVGERGPAARSFLPPRCRTTAGRSRSCRTAMRSAGRCSSTYGLATRSRASARRGWSRAPSTRTSRNLRFLYSQSAFSPDGRFLAVTAERRGDDVLYLFDVRTRKPIRRFELGLETATGPTWSPDGRQLVFSGGHGGMTDLYIVNVDGTGASPADRRLGSATSSRSGRRTAERSRLPPIATAPTSPCSRSSRGGSHSSTSPRGRLP